MVAASLLLGHLRYFGFRNSRKWRNILKTEEIVSHHLNQGSSSNSNADAQMIPIEKYIQVLPIIKLSPSYPNGKILLGKWKSGNYEGRYTGLIQKLKTDVPFSEEEFKRSLLELAKYLVPAELRDFVSEIKCQGILQFDGPPDSLEYVCVASIKSLIRIQEHVFRNGYPYQLEWFDINQLPFEQMPADDKIWYPSIIHGKKIQGSFIFGGLTERSIQSYELNEVKDLDI